MTTFKQYNYCLDFIKGIACIFVVFLHCEFPGVLGVAVQAISRYCVPFFFMVSGYFSYKDTPMNLSERKRKVGHILKITVYSSLFYIFFALFQYLIWGDISLAISKKSVIIFLLFNQMKVIVSQMWFLYALLYVYIVYLLIGGNELYKRYSILITVFCLVSYVVLAQGLHTVGISAPNYIYKNWLIEGLGFFTLGFVLHQKQSSIEVNNSILLVAIAIFTLLNLLERYFFGRDFGVNVCSIPQVIAIFLYCINNPTKHVGALQKLGKSCSLFVYILHPFVWHSLERVYSSVHLDHNMVALYLMPIFVLVITILLSIFSYRLQYKRIIKVV